MYEIALFLNGSEGPHSVYENSIVPMIGDDILLNKTEYFHVTQRMFNGKINNSRRVILKGELRKGVEEEKPFIENINLN